MSRVLVLGNAGVDLSLRLPRLPLAGETLVGSGLARAPGGKGLNQAVVAARTGVGTWFLTPVGDDPDGRFVANRLAAEAFASLRLVRVAYATDVSVLMVGADGENSIVTAGPCAEALDAATAAEFAADAGPRDVLLLRGVGAWTPAATAESPTQAAQRRIDAGLAVRIMRLSTWTASATSPP